MYFLFAFLSFLIDLLLLKLPTERLSLYFFSENLPNNPKKIRKEKQNGDYE